MKNKKYKKTRRAIINYLKKKQCFCFRKSIIADLVKAGHKKSNIINTLSIMRRKKELRLWHRRWGL